MKEYDKHPMHPNVAKVFYAPTPNKTLWVIAASLALFASYIIVVLDFMPLFAWILPALLMLLPVCILYPHRYRQQRRLNKVLLVWEQAPAYAEKQLARHHQTTPSQLLTQSKKYKFAALVTLGLAVLVFFMMSAILPAFIMWEIIDMDQFMFMAALSTLIPLVLFLIFLGLLGKSTRLKNSIRYSQQELAYTSTILPSLASQEKLRGALSPELAEKQGELSIASTEKEK